MRTDADRLGDILLAIAKIRERAGGGVDAFERDEMLQVWVIHHLQVIGEAARGISQGVRDRCPEVQWPQIVALRNILVHEYFGLNLTPGVDDGSRGPARAGETDSAPSLGGCREEMKRFVD